VAHIRPFSIGRHDRDRVHLQVPRSHSSLAGELALPGVHHGEPDGFVLPGSKPNGETCRPDEIEVLGHTAHQVGLDFRALRTEQLERGVAELSARNQDLLAHNAALNPAIQRRRRTMMQGITMRDRMRRVPVAFTAQAGWNAKGEIEFRLLINFEQEPA